MHYKGVKEEVKLTIADAEILRQAFDRELPTPNYDAPFPEGYLFQQDLDAIKRLNDHPPLPATAGKTVDDSDSETETKTKADDTKVRHRMTKSVKSVIRKVSLLTNSNSRPALISKR